MWVCFFFERMAEYVMVRWLEFSFFFSSRRRHTSLVSDWSSDVCSSDLGRIIRFSYLDVLHSGHLPSDDLHQYDTPPPDMMHQVIPHHFSNLV